jgi:site-specific DNA recombinase
MSKLKANKKYILDTLIKQIEMLKNRSNPEQESIHRINKEIADLSAKNHMLAKLHTKGILKDAEFTVQVTEISKKQQKLKDEHRKIISEDKNSE